MKNRLTFLYLLPLLFIAACKDEGRQAFNQIEGTTWRVERLAFRDAGKDSTATPTNFLLNFQDCSYSKNKEQIKNCQAQVSWNNRTYPMWYQVTRGVGGVGVRLALIPEEARDASYRVLAERVDGFYRVIVLEDNRLELLTSQNCDLTPPSSACKETRIIATR